MPVIDQTDLIQAVKILKWRVDGFVLGQYTLTFDDWELAQDLIEWYEKVKLRG